MHIVTTAYSVIATIYIVVMGYSHHPNYHQWYIAITIYSVIIIYTIIMASLNNRLQKQSLVIYGSMDVYFNNNMLQ